MNGNRLQVRVHGRSVGQIIRGGGGFWPGSEEADYTFLYEPETAEDLAVSIIMPVSREFYPGDGQLHPIFDMNLPEGRLREEIRLRFAKTMDHFDNLALLSIVGSSMIGRLRYESFPLMTKGEGVKTESSKCNLAEFMSYAGSDDLLDYLLRKYAAHSGVAGVQPKVLVQDSSGAGLSAEALQKISVADATHIIKSWDESFPQLAANEFFCIQAAAKAGLKTPAVELSMNGKLLAVRRFDLDQATGQYHGFEDFCALSGYPSGGRYFGSYERLAKGLELHLVGNALVDAQRDFFKMLVLNCMVRNGDAHLKNFGVLYGRPDIGSRLLAPTFDVVTTTIYLPNDTLALTLNKSKSWPDGRALTEFGVQHCRLYPKETRTILEQVADAITDTRPALREYAKGHPDFSQLGEQMLRVWDEGVVATHKKSFSPSN